jgi:hypothetical protein
MNSIPYLTYWAVLSGLLARPPFISDMTTLTMVEGAALVAPTSCITYTYPSLCTIQEGKVDTSCESPRYELV